jgi:hypothetical protein
LADQIDVGTWLSKMKSAFSGEADVSASVRRELEAMQRLRSKLVVEVMNPARTTRETLAAIVEQVRDQDVVISQPSTGALTRPLAAGERVVLQLPAPGGVNAGEARVLGRIKLPSGGKRMFFGYRLTIPERFQFIERRLHPRFALGRAALRAQLAPIADETAEVSAALSGLLVDISLGGAQVMLEGEAAAPKPGTTLTLTANFPAPVGSIAHPVTVARAEHDASTNVTRIGLQFDAPVPNLDAFLDVLKSANARKGSG